MQRSNGNWKYFNCVIVSRIIVEHARGPSRRGGGGGGGGYGYGGGGGGGGSSFKPVWLDK